MADLDNQNPLGPFDWATHSEEMPKMGYPPLEEVPLPSGNYESLQPGGSPLARMPIPSGDPNKPFSAYYDDPITPAEHVRSGHGYEYERPTRPGMVNPEFYPKLGTLQGMSGAKSGNDVRMLHEGYERFNSLPPEDKLKWVMKVVGDPPLTGGRAPESVDQTEVAAMRQWQVNNIEKIMGALIRQDEMPKPPISGPSPDQVIGQISQKNMDNNEKLDAVRPPASAIERLQRYLRGGQ